MDCRRDACRSSHASAESTHSRRDGCRQSSLVGTNRICLRLLMSGAEIDGFSNNSAQTLQSDDPQTQQTRAPCSKLARRS